MESFFGKFLVLELDCLKPYRQPVSPQTLSLTCLYQIDTENIEWCFSFCLRNAQHTALFYQTITLTDRQR